MATPSLLRATALIVFVACAVVFAPITAQAQQSDDLDMLSQQVERLYGARKYAEATDIAKRALAVAERQFGPGDAKVMAALSKLARLYDAQGRYGEAEPLYKRALAVDEQTLGADHPNVGRDLDNLAGLYHTQGRYAEAEPLFQRALAIDEKAFGPDHRNVVLDLSHLAWLYRDQGRYAEAEPLDKRALAIAEKGGGLEHPDVGGALNNLAAMYDAQGRYAEAEPLYKRALAIQEKALGPEHSDVGITLNGLATLYVHQGRYAESEPLYKRALAIHEKALGPEHPEVGTDLNNLALLYQDQGRYAEAEPLYNRALAIAEKAFGPEHPTVGAALNSLAFLYNAQGRYAEAEPLYKRALAIHEKALGPEHPEVGRDLNNLAAPYLAQGRYAEAEPLFKRALVIWEKALGPEHPTVGAAINNLAELYRAQRRFAEAEPLYQRALAIEEKALGPEHPTVGTALDNLARLYFAQSDWERAADYWRRSTSVTILRARRGTLVGEALTGKRKSEAEQQRIRFEGLIKAVYRLAPQQHEEADFSREMFQTAQWARSSEAAQSLAQMAARGAKDDPKLAALVRERQDKVADWQKRDVLRNASVALAPDARKQQADAEAENTEHLRAIDTRIAEIDTLLKKDFPDYAALASPAPLSVEEVQAQLAADEALVLFLDTPKLKLRDGAGAYMPEETFIWVVTQTNAKWVRSVMGTPALSGEVSALRCGLDREGAWFNQDGSINPRCTDLLKIAYTDGFEKLTKPLPFDLMRAYQLYQALFGQIEDLIKGKHLLIVPSGPLTQLPFQVLVSEPPKVAIPGSFADYRNVAWLARQHGITVLPAVSSLKALRELAKESHASELYVGFGDPLLNGDPADFPEDAERAKLAREKRCDPTLRQRVASLLGLRGGSRTMMTRSNGAIDDVADLRRWAPLPETADELCDVAHDLDVDPKTHLYLGASATEAKIKQLSESGALAKYKIVHLATHGAVAGDVSRASEPGLLLTPPDKASETDDGYLSASEIAGLKLDADWVILSACNTAAAEAKGAEALSGLARAFFYAGARSLLVSHWEVDSEATVKLITKAVDNLKTDPKIGRAEALRESMLAMIDRGQDVEAHPAFWAPFVLVGEGGAAR
jgi:tetratricopeptide (TPR) repeat protein